MRKTRFLSAIAIVTASSLLGQSLAGAYPSDVFATASPVPSPNTTDPADPAHAPENVDATGAVTYSIPVPTAPNRQGLVPSLALTYSSRNPVRGGVAMGWELNIPRIEVDTSHGHTGDPRYRASGGGKLILVEEPVEAGWESYRGEEDGSFTRYERAVAKRKDGWRARTPDGMIHYFGQTDESRDMGHPRAEPGATEGRWFITRTVDKFGNEIVYNYTKTMAPPPEGGNPIPVDITLASVEYGANPGAGLTHHSRIVFEYNGAGEVATTDLCPGSNVPIGARFDFRTGIPIYEGARRLTRVTLETRSAGASLQERRRLDLGYDTSELQCPGGVAHAPLRILTSVQETGFAEDGTATVLPAQTFDYNRLERTFDSSIQLQGGIGDGVQGNLHDVERLHRSITNKMLLDVDGDSRADRLEVGPLSGANECTASWEKNVGLSFEQPASLGVNGVMPTLPWEDGVSPSSEEVCSLTHQISFVSNRSQFEPYDPDTCTLPPPQTTADTQNIYRFLDWDRDGLVDLVTSVESKANRYRPELDSRIGPDPTCSGYVCPGIEVAGLGCINTNENVCARRSERACGHTVYRVHRNEGGGAFSDPVPVLAPVPLDGPDGPGPLLMDLNGDGYLDGVTRAGTEYPGSDPQHFHVYLGHPDGSFDDVETPFPLPLVQGPDEPGSALDWLKLYPSYPRSEPQEVGFCVSNCGGDPQDDNEHPVVLMTELLHWGRLTDVNGDGLEDYVLSHNTGLRVFYNTGRAFEQYAAFAPEERGSVLSDEIDSLDLTQQRPKLHMGPLFPEKINDGFSRAVLRYVDFDNDGLTDVVRLPPVRTDDPDEPDYQWDYHEPYIAPGDAAPELFVNVGDRFVNVGFSAPLDRAQQGLSRAVVSTGNQSISAWAVRSDFVDLDGDGLSEAYGGRNSVAARFDSDTQPMRYLKAVHNGRGGHTAYHYRLVTGEAVPHPVWVADAVTSYADIGAESQDPPLTTQYAYETPVYGPDKAGDYAFRGFETVTVTTPGGAEQVVSRDYSQYYGGLVTLERTYDEGGQLIRRTSTTYEQRLLFDDDALPGAVTTFHPAESMTRTCRVGQDEAQCEASGDLATHETFYVGVAPVPGGPTVLHTVQMERTGLQIGAQPGSTIVWHVPQVLSDESTYLQYSDGEEGKQYDANGVLQTIDAVWHYYDASKRCELWTSHQVDATPSYAVSTQLCDGATGNLVHAISPRFYGSGPGTSYEYDADMRFLKAVVNPLGHRVESTTDAATGTVTSERGPNRKTAANGVLVAEGWVKTLDGLGRELTHSVFLDDPTLGYAPEIISRYTYIDTASPRLKVTEEHIVHGPSDPWTKRETEIDGLGRSVLEATYEVGVVKAVTKSFYDGSGNLTRVLSPKPSSHVVASVEWQYAYDSLGRLLAAREPTRPGCEGALTTQPPFGWCGTRYTYDGLSTTAEDVVGTIGGQAGRTRTTLDPLGRLVLVEEELDAGVWAVTEYEHDGRGRVLRTTNADGVETEAQFDMLGRRTQSSRSGKTWGFGYDPNGNLVSVASPVPAGEDPTKYVTHQQFDELDRLQHLEVAPRALSPSEIDSMGDLVVERTYDGGDNGIGRLTRVENDNGWIDYEYEGRGFVAKETHHYSIFGGQYEDERTIERDYLPSGRPRSVAAADALLSADKTRFYYHYDPRGLPKWVGWSAGSANEQLLYIMARFTSGLPYRYYTWENGALTQDALRGFDDAGRPSGMLVRAIPPGATALQDRAWESFQFDGAGDVARLRTQLTDGTYPLVTHTASYQYDRMHRLISATAPQGYQGTFAYSPGGRITAATVSADPTAERVHERDVTYVYGGDIGDPVADPDAPVELVNAGTTNTYMAIEYDLFGNAIQRDIKAEGSFEHLYDGLDRQRIAANPDGSMDVYFYGPDGMRSIVVTQNRDDSLSRVKWSLGETEIIYDGEGGLETEIAYANLDGSTIRVVDHQDREYLYNDSRGHLLAAFDEAGNMKAGFRYGPYGELLEAVGSDEEDFEHRFNNKERDATSGLSYYGYRYYDERSLAWTQADPKYRMVVEKAGAEPLRASLYSFSLGNPVGVVDPDGREGEDPIDIQVLYNGAIPTDHFHKTTGNVSTVRVPDQGVQIIVAEKLFVAKIGSNYVSTKVYTSISVVDGVAVSADIEYSGEYLVTDSRGEVTDFTNDPGVDFRASVGCNDGVCSFGAEWGGRGDEVTTTRERGGSGAGHGAVTVGPVEVELSKSVEDKTGSQRLVRRGSMSRTTDTQIIIIKPEKEVKKKNQPLFMSNFAPGCFREHTQDCLRVRPPRRRPATDEP
ncbi:MAG: hypothetical protein HOW73_33950 [Polyangiaceae bacterium]|nr:hypothetical protein [Polyangiaceae bacterium]